MFNYNRIKYLSVKWIYLKKNNSNYRSNILLFKYMPYRIKFEYIKCIRKGKLKTKMVNTA